MVFNFTQQQLHNCPYFKRHIGRSVVHSVPFNFFRILMTWGDLSLIGKSFHIVRRMAFYIQTAHMNDSNITYWICTFCCVTHICSCLVLRLFVHITIIQICFANVIITISFYLCLSKKFFLDMFHLTSAWFKIHTHQHNAGQFWPSLHFLQNKMQMCTASSHLLLVCFPTSFSPYMNIMDTNWSISLKTVLIFLTFHIAKISFKLSKYKNIQE